MCQVTIDLEKVVCDECGEIIGYAEPETVIEGKILCEDCAGM